MKYLVIRTSTRNDASPCSEAHSDEYTHWCYYTLPPDKIVKKWPELDPAKFEKARGGSRYPQQRRGWFVDIDTLDHLMDFTRNHGDAVICWDGQDIPTIEIYDWYRE